MTAFLFGRSPADYVVADDGSGGVMFKPGAALTGWNLEEQGSQYPLTSDEAQTTPLTNWTANDAGHANPAYGPDEVKQMWVSADGGPRVLMTASNAAQKLGDRIDVINNSIGQPNGLATLDGNGRVPASSLPAGSGGGAVKLGDLTDVDATSPADGAVPAYSSADGKYEVGSALAALIRSPALTLGLQPDPLIKFVSDHVPDAADQNMLEFWSTYSGTPKLVAWLNERGMYRAEQIPGGTGWESPVKAIVSYQGTGDAIGIERRNADNSRTLIGGFDVRGRLKTSLGTWAVVTAYDPNATGWYSAGTTDTSGGGGPYTYDALGCRMDTDDVVRMRGLVAVAAPSSGNNLNSGDVLFTVPAGFAPSVARAIVVGFRGGKAFPCVVTTGGQVIVRQGQNNSGASNVFFDGVTYLL